MWLSDKLHPKTRAGCLLTAAAGVGAFMLWCLPEVAMSYISPAHAQGLGVGYLATAPLVAVMLLIGITAWSPRQFMALGWALIAVGLADGLIFLWPVLFPSAAEVQAPVAVSLAKAVLQFICGPLVLVCGLILLRVQRKLDRKRAARRDMQAR